MTFKTNDISENLNLLQSLVLTIASQQDESVDHFNSAVDEIEALRAELAQTKAELEASKETNQKIHADRLAILSKCNENADIANAEIRRLSTKSQTLALELSELRKIDPERMKKLYEAQKTQNVDLKKANERLTADNALLKERNNKLRSDLSIAHDGVWGFGIEKIIPYNGDVTSISTTGERASMNDCVWWHSEKGVRLLCGYNESTDSIVICDPRQDGSDNIVVPTLVAEKAMKDYFKKLIKAKAKTAKKAA